MKSTFRILFYLKRNGQKANGNMPIMGRITVNGQAVQFGAKAEINLPKVRNNPQAPFFLSQAAL